MVKLVGDDVPSIEQFMTRYRVSISSWPVNIKLMLVL